MRKIMFNDRFLLTRAVIEGRKTQTRRFPSPRIIEKYDDLLEDYKAASLNAGVPCSIVGLDEFLLERPPYKIGEVVAVAQSYKNAGVVGDTTVDFPRIWDDGDAGYLNKMFVKSELMPHQVEITNVRVQKLQEITYHDCLREGVYIFDEDPMNPLAYIYTYPGANQLFYHPIDAYAQLIDAISGKGTWESNPYVYVYDFKLVR